MIVTENVVKHYDNGLVKAVNGVSLHVPPGEFCSVMGPSGCGKSTLLHMIGALDLPTSGEIRIDGRPLRDHRPLSTYRRRHVGFVFQLHNLVPSLTLAENVELPLFPDRSVGRRERRERAMALLEEMELSHRASFFPTQISGGERQRAAVARALINDPRLLLADEPTGSVDSRTAGFIMEAILRRCRERRMTVLLVTHDEQIARHAGRTVRIRDGLLVGDSSRPGAGGA